MATLKVTLFHTKSVSGKAQAVFNNQIDKGNEFLKSNGIKYHRHPASGSIELPYDKTLEYEGGSDPGLQQRLDLRALANSAYYSTDNRLPVILCNIACSGTKKTQGEAVGSPLSPAKIDWLPFVIIDADRANPDGLTLTHEAGHCAGLKHPGNSPLGEPRLMENGNIISDNFMAYGTYDIATNSFLARSLKEDWQIAALLKVYFCSA